MNIEQQEREDRALASRGQGVGHGSECAASLHDLVWAALGSGSTDEPFENRVLQVLAIELLVIEVSLGSEDLAPSVVADAIGALAERARCAAELGRRMRRAVRAGAHDHRR